MITKEQLLNASTYIPIVEKQQLCEALAKGCVVRVDMSVGEGETAMPLPPRYQESLVDTSMMKMDVLLSRYLGVKSMDEPITAEIYDQYAHVRNDLERFKSDKECRDVVFDLLEDFKDFEKRLNSEIYNFLQAQNDVVGRLSVYISQMMSEEYLGQLTQDIERLKGEIAEQQAELEKGYADAERDSAS